jgi:hypothetical protein
MKGTITFQRFATAGAQVLRGFPSRLKPTVEHDDGNEGVQKATWAMMMLRGCATAMQRSPYHAGLIEEQEERHAHADLGMTMGSPTKVS